MPSVLVNVSIHYSPHTLFRGPDSTGIWAASAEDVIELGEASSLPVSLNQGVAKLEFIGDESDSRLIQLYEAIWNKYGLRPKLHHVIPLEDRNAYFGLRRNVRWSKSEIDESELLWLRNKKLIATHASRNPDQLAREEYVASLDSKQRSSVQFGSLMPFTALGVAEPLRTKLIAKELKGLYLPSIIFVPEKQALQKPLWGLRSSVILPNALNLLQGEHGNPIAPNSEWWCWWDDGGRDPVELRYDRAAVEELGCFDIAMTSERVGQTEQGAYRQCVVSQKFRKTLTDLNVKGVDYVPVKLV